MQKDVIFSEDSGTLTAHIGCDLDHHTAKPIREKIDRRLLEIRPHTLVIDFSRVEFMDSSGLALILGRVECAGVIGARVHLSGLSPQLLKLVKLAGIEKIKNLTVSGG